MSLDPSTTLADSLTPPVVANPFSTMRASLDVEPAATPIPSSLPLFVSAIVLIGLLGWYNKKGAAIYTD